MRKLVLVGVLCAFAVSPAFADHVSSTRSSTPDATSGREHGQASISDSASLTLLGAGLLVGANRFRKLRDK